MNTASRIIRISETRDWHEIERMVERWDIRERRLYAAGRFKAADAAFLIRHALRLAGDRSAFLEMSQRWEQREEMKRLAECRRAEIVGAFARSGDR